MLDVILKRFDRPDEIRNFPKGKFELIEIGGMTIGRATYQPGWKWSIDVGAALGTAMCQVEHVGMVISGRATAAMEDGRIIEMRAGDVFYIAPGHDSWVVGDEPYVSLHFLGAEKYAAAKKQSYSARKFCTSFLPSAVSTLSGWNWTPSTGNLRCLNPMMTDEPS